MYSSYALNMERVMDNINLYLGIKHKITTSLILRNIINAAKANFILWTYQRLTTLLMNIDTQDIKEQTPILLIMKPYPNNNV